MGTVVALERYARIRAEMEAGMLRDEVLTRAGLTVDEWAEAQLAWLEQMGTELERGRFDLASRYGEAFVARQSALAHRDAPVSVGARPGALPVQSRVGVEAALPPVESTPTFLKQGAAGTSSPNPAPLPTVRRVPAALSGTSLDLVPPKGPMLPFAPGAAPAIEKRAPAPAAEKTGGGAMPVVQRAPAALSGTSLSLVVPKGPALPFAAGANPAPQAGPPAPAPGGAGRAMPVVHRALAALSGTSLSLEVPSGPALPFAPGVSPASGDVPSPAAKASPPMPPVVRAPAALSGTSLELVVPKGPALPFASEAAAAPPGAASVDAALPGDGPALPATLPPSPSAPPVPLTLEQYASLCVDIASAPAQVGELMHRYGLTMEQGRAVDAHWKSRVAADPAVRAAFDRAYGGYQAWLATARGKGAT